MTDRCLSDEALWHILRDDVPHGDLTTELLRIGHAQAFLEMRLRAAGVLAGIEEGARLLELAGAKVEVLAETGTACDAQRCFLRAQGSAAALHRGWKVAQTLIEYATGVASRAAAIVALAVRDGQPIPVACTRKVIPGTKALAMRAVRAGGAWPHRLGLSDTVLIFPEHRVFLDDTPADTVKRLRRQSPERTLVAEVCSVDEALAWADAGIDVVQLEKFTPEQLAMLRDRRDERGLCVKLAPAGGIHEGNAAAYAAAGADVLVSSAPYYAAPKDVSVSIHAVAGTALTAWPPGACPT